MNKIGFWMGAFCLGASFIPVVAQEDNTPIPPYVASVPAPAEWTIQVTYKQPHPTPPSPPPQVPNAKPLTFRYLDSVEVAKVGSKRRIVQTWSDGVQTEIWHVNDIVLFRQPQFASSYVAIYLPGTETRGPVMPEFLSGDFPVLAWVDIKSYKGHESHDGRDCFCYENFPYASPPVKAWIDVATGLPVAVDNGLTIQSYSFSRGAPASLTLPPLYAKRLDDYLVRKAAVVHLPPPN